MFLLKLAFGVSIFFILWIFGIKQMSKQACHSTNSHMLLFHHINAKVQSVLKPSFYLFLARNGCLGVYRHSDENTFKYLGADLKDLSLELNLEGAL